MSAMDLIVMSFSHSVSHVGVMYKMPWSLVHAFAFWSSFVSRPTCLYYQDIVVTSAILVFFDKMP